MTRLFNDFTKKDVKDEASSLRAHFANNVLN